MTQTGLKALAWIDEELRDLDQQNLRRDPLTHRGPQGVLVNVDGRELVNFGSNDYLNLAADPRLTRAVAAALQTDGWGAGASPLVTGHSQLHQQLESRLAEFEQAEAALLFSAGYAANIAAVTSLVGREDAIFGDQKNHASIIDGCRLSRAEIHVYPHCDCDQLEHMLKQAAGFRRRLIVTDSVFSMDGDLAPLADLAQLAERFDCMLMVDEAHATGVFGESGRGLCEAMDVVDRVDVRVGTLSKALGCAGGFITGNRSLIEWLVNRARTYVFSTAHPPAACAAACAALDVVRDEPDRGSQLLDRAQSLRERLVEQGWDVGASASQIIPIIVGQPDHAMRLSDQLRERGLLVPGIRPPSVPAGQSLLRVSLSYGHQPEMIERLLAALAERAASKQ